MKRNIHYTVSWGKPFEDFQQRSFFIGQSDLGDQPGQTTCATRAEAERCAQLLVRRKKGSIKKTTVEEIEVI